MKITLTLSLLTAVSANVASLTSSTYASATAGKVVFVKFFAPWCGHCKSMAPDWEKLANDYKGNDNVLIAEVDCTKDENEPLCGENDVQGFPTLRYGDPSALETYEGSRSYDDLSEFSKQNLKPSCSPVNIHLCDGEKKAKIEQFMNMSGEELSLEISKVDQIISEADTYMQAEVEKLQATYENLMAKVEETKKVAKADSSYSIMKAVAAMKKKTSGTDEL